MSGGLFRPALAGKSNLGETDLFEIDTDNAGGRGLKDELFARKSSPVPRINTPETISGIRVITINIK